MSFYKSTHSSLQKTANTDNPRDRVGAVVGLICRYKNDDRWEAITLGIDALDDGYLSMSCFDDL